MGSKKPLKDDAKTKALSFKNMMAVYLKGIYVKDSLSIMAKNIRLQEFLRILTAGKVNYIGHFADNNKVFLDEGGFDNCGSCENITLKGQ